MPEYLSPGVYIEEIPGPQPIQGVSTSTAGMVGVTQRGPTEGKPVLVTSFAEFRDRFGGYLDAPDDAERLEWELDDQEGGFWWRFPLAVKGFFDNGGRRLYVKRVVSSNAAAAEVQIPTSAIAVPAPGSGSDPLALTGPAQPSLLRAVAKARGAWGNDIEVRVRPGRARSLQAVHGDGTGPIGTTLTADLEANATDAKIRSVGRLAGLEPPLAVQIAGERFIVVAPLEIPADGPATLVLPRAPSARRLSGTAVKLHRRVDKPGAAAQDPVRVPLARTDDDAVYEGALVLLRDDDGDDEVRAQVAEVEPAPAPPAQGPRLPGAVQLQGADLPQVFESDLVHVIEAVVDVRTPVGGGGAATDRDELVITETFLGLRLHPTVTGDERSIVELVSRESNLVSLQVVNPNHDQVGFGRFPGNPTDVDSGWVELEGGDDAAADLAATDFVGEDGGSGRRTGIQAFEDIEDISICLVPGLWSRTVQSALLAHCDRMKDRFAVLDAQRGLDVQGVRAFREPLSSNYAALYHPWLVATDPLTNDRVPLPPSGHVAGLYAAVDNDRGVHKAPANVVIRQIVDLDDDINEREQDTLNPVGINALRAFPNRGLRVWGARTISAMPEWRYVNVRRLFIFIEKSVRLGTQWVVFEPNAEPLWALVVQAVTNFLDTVWRTGALEGLKQEEAFFVRCDRSTMTEDDIASGRLVVEIGIAPVKPAEFVIFRFRQKTREQVAAA